MELAIIVAMDRENAIGRNGDIPWHIPDDLKRFKKITSGHPVIMGRKTFDSIGKPLPNRKNIVISRKNESIPGCIVINDPNDFVYHVDLDGFVFVIGGESIYDIFLPITDYLFITTVQDTFANTDTFFPDFDPFEWKSIGFEDKVNYCYIDLERKEKVKEKKI